MWNVYETPWLLVAVSLGLFLVVGTLRSAWPEKAKAWTWLIPILALGAGIGIDFAVKTDHEKIRTALKQLVSFTEAQDILAIDRLVAAEYSDSYHRSKTHLMEHIRSRLSRPVFEKIKPISLHVDSIEEQVATAGLTTGVVFDPESSLAQVVGKSLIARVEFEFTRQANGQWLLSMMELTEVNKQPVNWRQASGQF